MKLPCPSCAQSLNVPDNLAGKTVTCPKCKKPFQAPPPVAPVPAPVKPASSPDLELQPLEPSKQESQLPDPTSARFCPKCGAPWKSGEVICERCQYHIVAGRRVHLEREYRAESSSSLQKLFMYALALGALYGVFWLVQNWGSMKKKVENSLENQQQTAPAPKDADGAKK
jgi:uncharacterized paraquat-inducible protein A